MRLPSKLADRIAEEFLASGTHVYPIARHIDGMVRLAGKKNLLKTVGMIVVSFTLGFALCFAWVVVQITAINDTISEWRKEYVAEHVKHHAAELKPTTGSIARAIAGKLDREKEQK